MFISLTRDSRSLSTSDSQVDLRGYELGRLIACRPGRVEYEPEGSDVLCREYIILATLCAATPWLVLPLKPHPCFLSLSVNTTSNLPGVTVN